MNSANLYRILISGLLALFLSLPANAARQAGTAVFVSGNATATNAAGELRVLSAKDPVYSGDLLETGKGRIQIKYLDGAFMSIQPNSRFQIEDYNYENQSDGSEKAVYNLLKGGMRAFTGAIGKKHPDAYKVKTPVATIGIRGTGHNSAICSGCIDAGGLPIPDGLYHSTWEGVTTVANEFGTSEVASGKSVFVAGIDAPAQETNAPSPATAVQSSGGGGEDEGPQTLQAGEQLSSTGERKFFVDFIPVKLTQVPDQDLIGIEPNLSRSQNDPDNADGGILFETTVLVGPDSVGNNGMIGVIGTETDENNGNETRNLLITIDPQAILDITAPDARVATTQGYITAARNGSDIEKAALEAVMMEPATVAEYTVGTHLFNNYAYGRWTDGNVLFIDKVLTGGNPGLTTVEYDQLDAAEDLLFVFGETADTNFGATATGEYTFLGGSASTDTHGGINGVGVQPGSRLGFNFTTLVGELELFILHDTTYTVSGELQIDNTRFSPGTGGITAVAGGLSYNTMIDGSFFGAAPIPGADGAPALAGLGYEIENVPFDGQTGNSIIGNAIFGRSGPLDTGSATP